MCMHAHTHTHMQPQGEWPSPLCFALKTQESLQYDRKGVESRDLGSSLSYTNALWSLSLLLCEQMNSIRSRRETTEGVRQVQRCHHFLALIYYW